MMNEHKNDSVVESGLRTVHHANTDMNVREHTLKYAVDLVSAYMSNNALDSDEIPTLLKKTYRAVADLRSQAGNVHATPVPAVPIEESVTPDHIICLEDGKQLKMIKRHLKAVYNMSVEEYRQRWGLPADYPTVAPNYAKRRSNLAKVIGLGVNGRRKKKAS